MLLIGSNRTSRKTNISFFFNKCILFENIICICNFMFSYNEWNIVSYFFVCFFFHYCMRLPLFKFKMINELGQKNTKVIKK